MNPAAIRATLGEDSFELALAVDAVVVAYERRAAGRLVHRPVDARVLVDIASCIDLRGVALADDLSERANALERIVAQLDTKQRGTLVEALARDRRMAPWRPARGSQCEAFEAAADVDVLLLAGSAGSGKSEAAIGIGLLQHRVARYMRGTSLELAPILKRIGEIVGHTDGRNMSAGTWTLDAPFGFGGRGVTTEFAGLAEPDARLRWQGRAATMLCIDDAGSGTVRKDDIDYVARWLRSTERGLRKLLVYTSNAPTSRDSLWLRDEVFAPWLDPAYSGVRAQSGEIRYFLPRGDKSIEVPAGTPGAQSRTVVRSRTSDNVRLVRSGYLAQLANAPTELLRKRLLDDDWSAGWDQDDAAQVVPSSLVDDAMARWSPEVPCALGAIGIDVARGGADRSTIAHRHGNWFAAPLVLRGRDTPTGQSLAVKVLARYQRGAVAFVDATGVGASVFDILREKIPTTAIIFGAGTDELDATQSFGFSNVRSLLWWRFRELLGQGEVALPPDQELKRELCMPRYELRGGRLFVEDRASIIKRLGKSPDIATAFILAAVPTNSILAAHEQSDLLAALAKSNAKWREACILKR